MRDFSAEMLIIDFLLENVDKECSDYLEIKKFKDAFVTIKKFYNNLSDLEKYRKSKDA